MNWYFIIAGFLALITGLIHMILGEKWIFSKLQSDTLSTHYSGDVTKTTLRWFWHVGSFMVFFVSGVSLAMGFSDGIIVEEEVVGKLLALIYLGVNSILILLHISNPKQLKEYPQILIMLGIMVLLYLGSK